MKLNSFKTLLINLGVVCTSFRSGAQTYNESINQIAQSIKVDSIENTITALQSYQSRFLLNPNPVRDMMNISLSGTDEIKSINIFNNAGKLIFTNNKLSDRKIDVTRLISGIYFIKVTTGDMVYISKFVKN